MRTSTIGEKIKLARTYKEWSQEELAKRMGYKSKSTINKIELGINDVSQSKVVKFAEVLGVTVPFLMGWLDDDKFPLDPRMMTDKQIQFNAYTKEIMETDEKFMDVVIAYYTMSAKDKKKFYEFWELFKKMKD